MSSKKEIGDNVLVSLPVYNSNIVSLKLEGENPSGSIKDRLASHLIYTALQKGKLYPSQKIVEVTTGNSGIAFSRIASELGYQAEMIVPDTIKPEIIERIRYYGGNVVIVPLAQGIESFFELAEKKSKQGYFWPNQYSNKEAVSAYYALGQELLRDVPGLDYLVAGIGTGGTIMGAGSKIRKNNSLTKIIGVESFEKEHIDGIRNTNLIHRGDKDLYQKTFPDTTIQVSLAQASEAEILLKKENICASVSTSAALYACLTIADRVRNKKFVIISADGRRIQNG
ncbi:pyridoxal-phosphate dependent enzyme [Candidatus Woesearchaeota archaeon]|nr:pyridoxal-phosphate dependent enzyme [Candidatus Woesearchaeota archaeon]